MKPSGREHNRRVRWENWKDRYGEQFKYFVAIVAALLAHDAIIGVVRLCVQNM